MSKEIKSPRSILREYTIKIKKKIQETPDSVSFIFDIPQEYKLLFHYKPAQFLTFHFQIKGEKCLRSYSLSSCPLLNEDLKTTVKRVTGGIVSNYMTDHLKEGDTLLSRKPTGRFFKPPENLKPKHYFLFAGGSGITPLFSIVKTVLLSDPENKVTLFYANRNESSIIYHAELKEWAIRYKKQFNIMYILSREKTPWCNIYGRLEKKDLEKYFSNIPVNNPDHLYYLCGPLDFMRTVQDFLIQKQVGKTHIRQESFFSSTQKKQQDPIRKQLKSTTEQKNDSPDITSPPSTPAQNFPPPDSSVQPAVLLEGKEGKSEKNTPEIIRAFINEEKIEILAQSDIPILEQLLSAGHSPPFSCLSGSCMSCLAVLKKGRITQEERGILEDENLEKCEILTCQAKPESRLVEVDYDNL